MFDNVLVGIDGQEAGTDAVALARELAGPGASLVLANVYDEPWLPSRATDAAHGPDHLAAAQRILADVCRGLDDAVERVPKQATSPARGLHELAEDRDSDLLVMGSCRRGAIGRVMLGDDTRAGLSGAPCAVAVAPRGYAAKRTGLASIGVGYDGSRESAGALAAARELAAQTGARVRLLQVVTVATYPFWGVGPAAGPRVDELVAATEAELAGLEGVDTEVRYGLPQLDLAEFSKEVDLLVMGSRGYGPAMRMIAGSTSTHLLRNSRAPLLILPHGARRSRAGESDDDAGTQRPQLV